MSNFLSSYSTKTFYERHSEMNASAIKFGVENIFSFYDYDLKKTSFYFENQLILDNPKGAGFWLWKPYYIKQALNSIRNGDCLLYVDSGSVFINSPKELFTICSNNKSGIVPFDCWPLRNSEWTKRDTFINLDCDTERFWNSKHVIATAIAFRKCKMTDQFVSEWLHYCQNINSISDGPNIHGKDNLPNFVAHRMDQSILSILIEKYQIETYRNPSKWGNFLKLKDFRVKNEPVPYPYHVKDTEIGYSDEPYLNSPYGTIFEFNRMQKASLKNKNSILQSIIKPIKRIIK